MSSNEKKRSIEGKTYSITYRWDNFGRQRSVAYSNGFSVYYSYDSGGQVKAVTGFMGGTLVQYVKSVHYDEHGSRTRVEYGNGVITTYTYDDAMHRLVQLQTKRGDSSYQNIQYTYDKVGNILTRIEDGVVMSDSNPKTITHRYTYDTLYRLTEAEGSIKEEGNTVHSYTNTFTYSPIGNIMSKLQTVKVKGEQDPNLTYNYTYTYAGTKPHAVTNINDNLTYRYDANGNMTAIYDTAKNYSRILQWDEENRLIKTIDTTSGNSVTTTYQYDTKGMRITKDGPYGKTVYIDTGYVETNANIVSNHVFMGNTRIASIVKHKDESQPATYYYASDHLGSSSVLTNQTGSYHERIEYFPYGEVWVHNKALESGYSTPYRFTGKEMDPETGLYYFGARYYDARISRWISTDPALEKYFPKHNDYDTEHDFYWYILNDASGKLPGMGGVFNAHNLDMYCYSLNNPVKYYDPDGNQSFPYDIGNPFSFMIDLLKSRYETPFNEARNTTISTSAGFATGFIKGFFGPDFTKLVEKCGKEMQGFYVEEFMAAIDAGEITGQVAGLLNFTVGAYQSGKEGFKLGFNLGRNTFKEILEKPEAVKSFLEGYAKGLTPSINPPKFKTVHEAIGYLMGNFTYQQIWFKINNNLK